ncbi:hypothetical protein GCM10027445_17790 [Amycolatopsis endophytica]|uniref:Uncharacterized protein n=1 Tax=Amycolatopsis endophytica TaxID=860233 RepID=A0A853B630_9PSEU|nr:hypothetical protein [Amycolatopsis endophytica]NYI90006.1 hypothetical protein [Amycolatopsis endophytica]
MASEADVCGRWERLEELSDLEAARAALSALETGEDVAKPFRRRVTRRMPDPERRSTPGARILKRKLGR